VDYRLQCYTDLWWKYATVGFFLIALYPIGIPLFITYKVAKYRDRLDHPGVIAMFGMMYHGYYHDCWWFEVLDMLHKLCLTSLIAFLPTTLQLQGGMSFVYLYTACILLIRPYIRKGDDRLHLFAQNTLFLLFISAYVFRLDQEWDPTVDLVLSVAFIFLTGGFLIFLFSQFLSIGCKKIVVKRPKTAGKIAPYSKTVRKWLKDHEDRQVGRSLEEQNRMRAVKKRDDHGDTMMKRNPLYVDNTTTGLHTRMGEMHLMTNPLADANAGKNLAEMNVGADFQEAEQLLQQRGRNALEQDTDSSPRKATTPRGIAVADMDEQEKVPAERKARGRQGSLKLSDDSGTFRPIRASMILQGIDAIIETDDVNDDEDFQLDAIGESDDDFDLEDDDDDED
jgi:hypothetical protein